MYQYVKYPVDEYKVLIKLFLLHKNWYLWILLIDSEKNILLLDSWISNHFCLGKARWQTSNQIVITQNVNDAIIVVEGATGVQRREHWLMPQANQEGFLEEMTLESEFPRQKREGHSSLRSLSSISLFKIWLPVWLRDLIATVERTLKWSTFILMRN